MRLNPCCYSVKVACAPVHALRGRQWTGPQARVEVELYPRYSVDWNYERLLAIPFIPSRFVTVAKERFTAFEGLFQPELWGKDTPGLPNLVYDAIMACSIDSRKELCRFVIMKKKY